MNFMKSNFFEKYVIKNLVKIVMKKKSSRPSSGSTRLIKARAFARLRLKKSPLHFTRAKLEPARFNSLTSLYAGMDFDFKEVLSSPLELDHKSDEGLSHALPQKENSHKQEKRKRHQ